MCLPGLQAIQSTKHAVKATQLQLSWVETAYCDVLARLEVKLVYLETIQHAVTEVANTTTAEQG